MSWDQNQKAESLLRDHAAISEVSLENLTFSSICLATILEIVMNFQQ